MISRFLFSPAIGAVLATTASAQSPAASTEADMLLCMAADASESVTAADYTLQKEGHASAIRDRDVVNAIRAGWHGRIGAIYVEWANHAQQHIAAPWTVLDGMESATAFSAKIAAAPQPGWISNPVRNTAISEAIMFCMDQFARAPVSASRWVIDLSSDGTHNFGASLADTRQNALNAGATINALAIINSDSPFMYHTHENPEGGLPYYFESQVIGGTGSFVEVADGYEDFAQVIRRKFVLELSQLQ
jgi:hypothetical protein